MRGIEFIIDEFAGPWGPNGRHGATLAKWNGVSRGWKVMDEGSGAYRARDKAAELALSYGRSPAQSAMPDTDMVRSLHRTLFNTEGEKQMDKIDWHKPLQARNPLTNEVQAEKVYTYKSGKQRVIWIDDRVYPVDEQGRVVATVQYPGLGLRTPGQKIVENVPEEKFFLGLVRQTDGIYWLTNGGMPTTMSIMNCWKKLMGSAPYWIVDTRKSAEPPKTIAHDPEDYVTIWTSRTGKTRVSDDVMTKRKAEAYVSEPGEEVVRIRTTPAPVDPSRYIQLYRMRENGPWKINAHTGGSQEFTWDETKNRGANPFQCAIKVRD